MSRFRARCCRASANGRGSRPRCSTPIWSRSWCVTSTISTPASTRPASSRQQRFLMQSNGGVMPFSAAIAGGRTVHTLFSGPAAGAQASAYLAAECAAAASSRSTWAAPARHRLHRGRRAARNDRRRDRAPPGRCAGARYDHDLGRRRLDRVDRRRRLPRSSGRRARAPIRARPATDAAARSPTVTDADLVCGFSIPIISSAARRSSMSRRRVRRSKAHIAEPLKMDVLGGRRRHPAHRRHAHGRRGAGVRGQTRRRSLRLHAAAVRRRRRGARRRGRRRARHAPHPGAAAAGRVLGAGPALHRRGARLHPLRAAAARRSQRRPRRGHLPASSRQRRARSSQPKAWTATRARFARELDLRYTGQGYELRTPLDGSVHGSADARHRLPPRASASTSATRRFTAMPRRNARSKW